MNNKLYVAGDSFASLVKNQPEGNSWAELLANNLDLKLCNIARPAASNFSIALQIDWIIDRLKPNDLVIIYLTDHKRKTLVDLNVERDLNKSILELHSLHPLQKKPEGLNFSDKPRLISSHIHLDGPAKYYYRDWFDEEIQEIEDVFIITGILAKIYKITKNFLVCIGWFGNTTTCENFCIEPRHFLDIDSSTLLQWSGNNNYQNHLDDLTHLKFSKLIIKHLEKYKFNT